MNPNGKFKSLNEQIKILQEILYTSPIYKILRALNRAEQETGLKLYLAGGSVAQTVWNRLEQKPPNYGILDYDIVYFHDDTSYEAEDAVIDRIKELLPGISVDVKNQARVHLWFHKKFGSKIGPFASIGNAIYHYGSFAQTIAVRIDSNNDYNLEVIAPFGLNDIFTMTMRSNPETNIPLQCLEAKAAEFQSKWPIIIR